MENENYKTFFIKKIIKCKNLKQAVRKESEAEMVDVVMIDDGKNNQPIQERSSAIGFNATSTPDDSDD